MQPEKVYVFDTTLRDGEQALARRLGRREKLEHRKATGAVKVDIIEAGYPNSSLRLFSSVRTSA